MIDVPAYGLTIDVQRTGSRGLFGEGRAATVCMWARAVWEMSRVAVTNCKWGNLARLEKCVRMNKRREK